MMCQIDKSSGFPRSMSAEEMVPLSFMDYEWYD
jgi:hypothetical protein